jgi:hypothetical protein
MAADFVQMDTDAVSTLMGLLAEAARELDAGWQGVLSAIAGGEGAIGGDRIGQAIRGAYDAPGAALRDAAGRMPPNLLADADVGEQCAAEYRAADARGQAALGAGVAGGGPDARL